MQLLCSRIQGKRDCCLRHLATICLVASMCAPRFTTSTLKSRACCVQKLIMFPVLLGDFAISSLSSKERIPCTTTQGCKADLKGKDVAQTARTKGGDLRLHDSASTMSRMTIQGPRQQIIVPQAVLLQSKCCCQGTDVNERLSTSIR